MFHKDSDELQEYLTGESDESDESFMGFSPITSEDEINSSTEDMEDTHPIICDDTCSDVCEDGSVARVDAHAEGPSTAIISGDSLCLGKFIMCMTLWYIASDIL